MTHAPPYQYCPTCEAAKRRAAMDMQSDAFTVYSITDPRKRTPFYIGQTSNFPQRVAQHLRATGRECTADTIRALLDANLAPVFHILARCTDKKAALATERAAIDRASRDNPDLLNSMPGSRQSEARKWD